MTGFTPRSAIRWMLPLCSLLRMKCYTCRFERTGITCFRCRLIADEWLGQRLGAAPQHRTVWAVVHIVRYVVGEVTLAWMRVKLE